MLEMGIYNGQFISWERAPYNQKAKWSARWHRTGFTIRALIFSIIWGNFGLGWGLMSAVVAWPIYNMVIARYMGMPLLYIGETSFLDKSIPGWLTYASYIILLAASLFLILK